MTRSHHEWVRRARILLMDNYHPPFWPDLDFDAARLIEIARHYHANAIRLGSAGKWAVFPNTHWPTHPQLNGRDLIDETLRAARPHNIRVITYIPLGHIIPEDNIVRHHPEWQYKPAPNEQHPGQLHHGGGRHRPPCVNTPYHAAWLAFAKQLVNDHDVDAVYTDSAIPYHSHPSPRSNLCYCEYCQSRFRTQFGCAMPYAPDPHTLPIEHRRMLEQWSLDCGKLVADVLLEFVNFMRKSRDIPVMTHGCGMGDWPEDRIVNAHDGLLYEAGGDFLHRLEAASLGESSCRAMWQYVGALSGWSRLQWFSQDLAEEAVASFASGGAVLTACGANLYHDYPRRTHEGLSKFFSILDTNAALFDNLHPTRMAAIPYILPTRMYHMLDRMRFRAEPIRDPRADRPNDVIDNCIVRNPPQGNCIRGAFSAMTANHLPVQLIEQRQLSDPSALSRYPLLVLPNIGYLTADEIRAITQFVEAGGGLLATYRTSRYGLKPDDLLDNFALAELLGVDRDECTAVRVHDYHQHLWSAGAFDTYARTAPDRWLADGCQHEIWPVNKFEMVHPRAGTDVVANIVWGGRENEPLWPAVTSRTFGKGRVAYVAAAVEELHFEYRMLMIRDLLGAIVDWLCPQGRALYMDGPDQLLAIPNKKPGDQVLFLINHTGERVEHLPSVWPRYSQQFSYVPPVPNVSIRWRMSVASKPPRRVWDVTSGNPIDAKIDGNYMRMTLGSIGQYAIIAATW